VENESTILRATRSLFFSEGTYRGATAVSFDFTVGESDSSYSDETIDGRRTGTSRVGED